MSDNTKVSGLRRFDQAAFDAAYDKVILGNHFFEDPAYYHEHRTRYRNTIKHLVEIPMPRPATIFEIGGGQIVLLCQELFGDRGVLGDISEEYADAATKHGIEFLECDLMHTELDVHEEYDLIVFCEVFEHLPVPPHIMLEKMAKWLKPGGHLFLTTPNLYRLRNIVRLATGGPLFCNFFYPDPGHSLGHPLEYSVDAVKWQIERAGLEACYLNLEQLVNVGSSTKAKILRALSAPLMQMRPLWRDNIVALARKPL